MQKQFHLVYLDVPHHGHTYTFEFYVNPGILAKLNRKVSTKLLGCFRKVKCACNLDFATGDNLFNLFVFNTDVVSFPIDPINYKNVGDLIFEKLVSHTFTRCEKPGANLGIKVVLHSFGPCCSIAPSRSYTKTAIFMDDEVLIKSKTQHRKTRWSNLLKKN